MLNKNDYMTMTEAAVALGVSRQWMYQRVKNGTAPANIQLGGRTIFERAAVEAEKAKRKEHK